MDILEKINEAVYPDEINNKNKVKVWEKTIKIGKKEVVFLAAYQVYDKSPQYAASIIMQTEKVSDVLFEKDFLTKEEATRELNKFKFSQELK